MNWKPVDKYTRAGKDGKLLKCPKCESIHKVYHFAWSALGCNHCGKSFEKNLWLVETA